MTEPATAASVVPERFRSTTAPSFAGLPYDQQPRTAGTATTTGPTMQDALDAIQALADALDRTQANFVSAVCGRPVRDMCETLAENHAAALKGARLMPMPSTLMRRP